MTARYEFENYLVESLDSDLANTILANSSYYGANSNNTTSVYVSSENKNYMVSQDKQWVEVPIQYIKPYVKDYNTKLVVMYNPTFPVDYQWGKWLELATGFGLKVNTWVTPASTSSFANVPLINRYFKYGGFGNIDISEVNVPPLTSTIVRLPMENQPGIRERLTRIIVTSPNYWPLGSQLLTRPLKKEVGLYSLIMLIDLVG